MPRNAIRKVGATGNVCETGEVYELALRNFREFLLERITYHEDEVFAARARFQIQRAQDRDHFDRMQRRRLNNSREEKRGTLLQHFVQNSAADACEQERQALAEREFIADQKKLYLEHEEELQREFPLAFLDDESAGVIAFTLLPMLRGRLDLLARERTCAHKGQQKCTGETKEQTPVSMESGGHVRKHRVKQQPTVNNTPVKKEHDGGVDTVSNTTAAVEQKEEVGRGAYIVLETVPGAVPQRRVETEENEETQVGEEQNSFNAHNNNNNNSGSNDGAIPPCCFSRLTSSGEVEFVRIALLSNEQSTRARREEKQRFLEDLLASSTQSDDMRRVVELKLLHLKMEEERDALKEAERWDLWRTARNRINSNRASTAAETNENNTNNNDKNDSSGGGDNGENKETRECVRTNHSGYNGKIRDECCRGSFYSPSRLLREERRARMKCVRMLMCKDTSNNDNQTTSISLMRNNVATPVLNSSSCSFFDTSRWETICINDEDVGSSNNNNTSKHLEAMVDSYIWPQYVEDKIPHILCGEAVRTGKRWLSFQQEFGGAVTNEAEGETPARADHPSAHVTQNEEKKTPTVVAFPQCARKVWLKVDSLGDFVAGEVKFYQSHWHP